MSELTNLGTDKVESIEEQNTPGERTAVLRFSPRDGLVLILQNFAQGGEGIPLYGKFRDSNGDPLPRDTEVTLRFDAPHLDQEQVVSEKIQNIRQYRTLALEDQQSEDYIDRMRVGLKAPALEVYDNQHVEIALDTSAQIDWANSRVALDRDAVEVVAEG